MNRRNLLSTTVLATSAVALAACATSTTAPTVQSVMLQIQYLLPLTKALVVGIGIAVPASAGLVNTALPYLDQATAAFQLLQSNMPVSTGLPIVQQVEVYLKQAVDVVASAISSAPAGSKLIQYTAEVQEAQAVLALITAFASGVQAVSVAARVRSVSLPMLHE